MEAKRAIQGAARGVGHILSGEAREKLGPLREQLLNGTAHVQSKAGRRIMQLADSIRDLGSRLERDHEARAVARRLEETADYLRFRSADGIARDAAQAIRSTHVIPIAVALVGAAIAYKLVASRGNRNKG